jgi:hypothetical protein
LKKNSQFDASWNRMLFDRIKCAFSCVHFPKGGPMNRPISKLSVVFALSILFVSTLAFGQAPKATTTTAAKPVQAAAEKLDINSATKEQLMKLPGIGEAFSQKIIDGRPYKAKNELTQKKIVPEATYARITDLIIATQPKAATATTPAKPATPAAKPSTAAPTKSR